MGSLLADVILHMGPECGPVGERRVADSTEEQLIGAGGVKPSHVVLERERKIKRALRHSPNSQFRKSSHLEVSVL